MGNVKLLRYYNILRPFLRRVDIYRYEKNGYGEITGQSSLACSVMGYPYSKYLQIIRNVVKSADITNMKNERMLIIPLRSEISQGYPVILSGDRFIVDGRKYRVIYVQDTGALRTLVCEREDSHVENSL